MDEYSPMLTRRSYERFKLETEGRLLLEDKEIHIDCWDFSSKGLDAFSNVSLPINNKVKIEFSIPWTNQLLTKDGRIVWCKEIDKNYYRFGAELDIGQ